jgi:hypothetical protein
LFNSGSFFLYLACLSHVFRFNEGFGKHLLEKYKAEFPEGPVCGLQIRRGEIVPKDGDINKSWKIRELFTLDDSLDKVIYTDFRNWIECLKKKALDSYSVDEESCRFRPVRILNERFFIVITAFYA